MTIRCELIGSQTVRAEVNGAVITVTGTVPVFEMCRRLAAAGVDPACELECYRDDVMCLRVRAIGTGVKLTVEETANAPRLRKWRPTRVEAPPIAPNGAEDTAEPVDTEIAPARTP
jgi:hypothetical protein